VHGSVGYRGRVELVLRVRLNDHFGIFIPVGKAINPYSKTNWEGTGVDPDVRVDPKESLVAAHRLAVEKLLGSAKNQDDRDRLSQVLAELKDAGKTPGGN